MKHPLFSSVLTQKIRNECQENPSFAKAHRLVQFIMRSWMVIILLDRIIGLTLNAYEGTQLLFPIVGGVLLILVAAWGERGHVLVAMMLLQINMAVFLIQFIVTCFYYRGASPIWSVVFYGASAFVLIAGSLIFFLNRNVEDYRQTLNQWKGKGERKPLFYRTNNRLVRNRDR